MVHNLEAKITTLPLTSGDSESKRDVSAAISLTASRADWAFPSYGLITPSTFD